jgi:RNA polymerase sigma-70 factor, ECF subfamily
MSATTAAAGSMPPGSDEFARLTDPFRPELLAHCYRMLGSIQDAEDTVQETMIRAWKSRGTFEGRASVRTWLYRIATNACLRAIENRARRPLPSGLGAPGNTPDAPPAGPLPEVPWLQPVPDAMVRADPGDPASIVVSRAGIRLALVAALQYLPGRQRAVLVLRDVLGWRASEVAGLLEVSTVAVNSALQRARAHLRQADLAEDDISEPADRDQRALVDQYAAAFENADVSALMRLITQDAVLEMPPMPTWFAGRAAIGRFLTANVLGEPGRFRMMPTTANGQPALAAYTLGDDGGYHAHAIAVFTTIGSQISRVVSFNDPALFAAFGLPAVAPS